MTLLKVKIDANEALMEAWVGFNGTGPTYRTICLHNKPISVWIKSTFYANNPLANNMNNYALLKRNDTEQMSLYNAIDPFTRKPIKLPRPLAAATTTPHCPHHNRRYVVDTNRLWTMPPTHPHRMLDHTNRLVHNWKGTKSIFDLLEVQQLDPWTLHFNHCTHVCTHYHDWACH